jgi:hypothetical protein
MKTMREVFVLHPVMEKNLSRVFKIPSCFPGILPGNRLVETRKIAVLSFLGERFCRGEGGFWTPLRW